MIVEVAETPTGTIQIPDLTALGVDLNLLEVDVGHDDVLAGQVKALKAMNGLTGYVWRDNRGQGTLLSHVQALPDSIMPITVTDASAAFGVDHVFYEMLAESRHIVRLKDAPKTYKNLTVRVVAVAASRSTFRDRASDEGPKLLDMAVRYIQEGQDEVLVVSYKTPFVMRGQRVRRSVAEAINDRLTDDEKSRTRHLTWGTHKASNHHRHIRRMLVLGLDYQPPAAHRASAGAALQLPMNSSDPSDHPTGAKISRRQIGGLRDSLLQAVMRGHARVGLAGDCGAMEVVVVQSPRSGLSKADYEGMFPGATIKVDKLLFPELILTGRMKEAADMIRRRLDAGEAVIAFTALYGEMETSRQSFGRLIKDPKMAQWLANEGLEKVKLNARSTAFQMISNA